MKFEYNKTSAVIDIVILIAVFFITVEVLHSLGH